MEGKGVTKGKKGKGKGVEKTEKSKGKGKGVMEGRKVEKKILWRQERKAKQKAVVEGGEGGGEC